MRAADHFVMWHSQPKWYNLIINHSSSWDFSCVSFPPSLLGWQLAALSWEQFWCSFSGQGSVRGPISQLPANPHACLGSQGENCWNPVTPQTLLPTNPAKTAAWAARGSISPSHLQNVQQSFPCLCPPEAHVLCPLAPWKFREAAPQGCWYLAQC